MAKLRIVLADDHALLRAGLAALIGAQSDMEVVGEAGDVAATISVAIAKSPDIVTLDLSMPGGQSLKAIETIRTHCPHTKVVVITTHDDPAYLRAALAAGCAGYIVKTAGDAEMLAAVRGVAQGRTVINLPLPAHEVQPMLSGQKTDKPGLSSLSEREKEVLSHLGRGRSNQEIADKLLLSVKTIETYRSRLSEKLGLKNRSELVAFALQMGLVDLSKLD